MVRGFLIILAVAVCWLALMAAMVLDGWPTRVDPGIPDGASRIGGYLATTAAPLCRELVMFGYRLNERCRMEPEETFITRYFDGDDLYGFIPTGAGESMNVRTKAVSAQIVCKSGRIYPAVGFIVNGTTPC